MDDLGTILSVWAHPDDEAYLAGGLMARAVDSGDRVVCVTATRGEAGSWDEERWPAAEMGSIREAELARCLAILGVTDHHWLDYLDGTCDEVPDEEGAKKVAEIMDEVRPDTVLTFGPEGMTEHPDHIAVHRWVGRAFERSAGSGVRLFHAVVRAGSFDGLIEEFRAKSIYSPTTPRIVSAEDLGISFELSADLQERKLRALNAQVSQVEPLKAMFGERAREIFDLVTREESYVLAATKR